MLELVYSRSEVVFESDGDGYFARISAWQLGTGAVGMVPAVHAPAARGQEGVGNRSRLHRGHRFESWVALADAGGFGTNGFWTECVRQCCAARVGGRFYLRRRLGHSQRGQMAAVP